MSVAESLPPLARVLETAGEGEREEVAQRVGVALEQEEGEDVELAEGVAAGEGEAEVLADSEGVVGGV